MYIDRNGFPQARSGSGAAYVKIVRSEQGFDREIRYFDIKGNPRLDEKGGFGDAPGDRSEDRPRRRCHQPGSRREGADAPQGRLRPVDRPLRRAGQLHRGWPTSTSKAGPPGTRMATPGAPPATTSGATRSRWPTSTSKAGPPGTRTATPSGPAGTTSAVIGSRGPTSTSKAGPRGTRTAMPDSPPATTSRATGPRWPASTSKAGQSRHNYGVARWTAQYDAQGREVRRAYFGDRRPVGRLQGGHRRLGVGVRRPRQRDAVRLLRRPTGSRRGTRTATPSGSSATTSGATSPRWPTSTSKAGPRGTRTATPRWTARYDERGNRTEVAYFDEQGRPTRHKDGLRQRLATGQEVRRAGQRHRGGLLRRGRPAHPAQGRLRHG